MPETTTNASRATARYKTVLAWLVIIVLFLWVCNSVLGSYGTYAFWTLGGATVLIAARRMRIMHVIGGMARCEASEVQRGIARSEGVASSELHKRVASVGLEARVMAVGPLASTFAALGQLDRAEHIPKSTD